MKLKVYICMKYGIFNVLQSDAATDVNRYAALFFTYFRLSSCDRLSSWYYHKPYTTPPFRHKDTPNSHTVITPPSKKSLHKSDGRSLSRYRTYHEWILSIQSGF